MTREKFTELLKQLQDEELRLNQTKGEEYAGSEDVLSNFKRISGALRSRGLNVPPEVVCLVYLQKHLDAIYSCVANGGKALSEPIGGRIADARLYLALLYALLLEREGDKAG